MTFETMHKWHDSLGVVCISQNMWEKARAFKHVIPDVRPAAQKKSGLVDKLATTADQWRLKKNEWVEVTKVPASKGSSIHTIRARWTPTLIELDCSCHSFKIGKQGKCKHTELQAQSMNL